jgi:hypothetical protein
MRRACKQQIRHDGRDVRKHKQHLLTLQQAGAFQNAKHYNALQLCRCKTVHTYTEDQQHSIQCKAHNVPNVGSWFIVGASFAVNRRCTVAHCCRASFVWCWIPLMRLLGQALAAQLAETDLFKCCNKQAHSVAVSAMTQICAATRTKQKNAAACSKHCIECASSVWPPPFGLARLRHPI